MTKLRSDVGGIIVERDALIAKLEAEDRVSVKLPRKVVSFQARPVSGRRGG